MKIIEAKNPTHWTNRGLVDLEVLFEGYEEFLPFTASPNDSEEHGRELFQKAIAGEYGPMEERVWIDPEATRPSKPSIEEVLEKLMEKVEALEAKLEEVNNAT